jgi:predicted anti-sigma-YlaC factor YlaD
VNCSRTRALFSDFCDERLSQKRKKAIKAHLSGCSKCQNDYAGFARILAVLKKLRTFDIPRNYIKGMKSLK